MRSNLTVSSACAPQFEISVKELKELRNSNDGKCITLDGNKYRIQVVGEQVKVTCQSEASTCCQKIAEAVYNFFHHCSKSESLRQLVSSKSTMLRQNLEEMLKMTSSITDESSVSFFGAKHSCMLLELKEEGVQEPMNTNPSRDYGSFGSTKNWYKPTNDDTAAQAHDPVTSSHNDFTTDENASDHLSSPPRGITFGFEWENPTAETGQEAMADLFPASYSSLQEELEDICAKIRKEIAKKDAEDVMKELQELAEQRAISDLEAELEAAAQAMRATHHAQRELCLNRGAQQAQSADPKDFLTLTFGLPESDDEN